MTKTQYDTEKFTDAHVRYLKSARELTDEDIEQFSLVDQELADRARAKRAGYVEPKTTSPEEIQAEKMPVKGGFLIWWFKDYLGPILATYKFRLSESRASIEELKKRVQALEARPELEYRGVHIAGDTYTEGHLATRSGALWLCLRSTTQTPGQSGDWRLIVKSGGAG